MKKIIIVFGSLLVLYSIANALQFVETRLDGFTVKLTREEDGTPVVTATFQSKDENGNEIVRTESPNMWNSYTTSQKTALRSCFKVVMDSVYNQRGVPTPTPTPNPTSTP